MGKRSNFERVARDYYPTPYAAVVPLIKHLPESFSFIEPCAGDGRLISHLERNGGQCVAASDIEPRLEGHAYFIEKRNCFDVEHNADMCITNPPWDRKLLHPMIEHFAKQAPTWFLFDGDWCHTKQSIPYMAYCKKIVSVGRVKWIEDSKMTGKDNVAWYLFHNDGIESVVEFYGRS